jgi:hypothetical protein
MIMQINSCLLITYSFALVFTRPMRTRLIMQSNQISAFDQNANVCIPAYSFVLVLRCRLIIRSIFERRTTTNFIIRTLKGRQICFRTFLNVSCYFASQETRKVNLRRISSPRTKLLAARCECMHMSTFIKSQ